jgi:hypothetical protein
MYSVDIQLMLHQVAAVRLRARDMRTLLNVTTSPSMMATCASPTQGVHRPVASELWLCYALISGIAALRCSFLDFLDCNL